MIVYARRDQAWVEGQPECIGFVADGGVIADDEGDGGGVASGVGGVGDAVRAAGAGGVRENGAGEVRVAETPRKRRLSAKSAVAEGDVVAASPVLREATTPERETKARRLESDLMIVVEEIEMSPKKCAEAWRRGVKWRGFLCDASPSAQEDIDGSDVESGIANAAKDLR